MQPQVSDKTLPLFLVFFFRLFEKKSFNVAVFDSLFKEKRKIGNMSSIDFNFALHDWKKKKLTQIRY